MYDIVEQNADSMGSLVSTVDFALKPQRYADLICSVALIVADCLAFLISFGVTFFLADAHRTMVDVEPGVSWVSLLERNGVAITLLLFGGVTLYLAARGCYTDRLPVWSELRLVVLASMFALLGEALIQVALQEQALRPILLAGWVLYPLCVASLRPQAKRVLDSAGLWRVPVLLISEAGASADVLQALRSGTAPGYRVVGCYTVGEAAQLSSRMGLKAWLAQLGAQRVLLAGALNAAADRQIIETILRERVAFATLPHTDVLPVIGCEPVSFFSHDTLMLQYRDNLTQPVARCAKAVFDLAIASVLLVLLLPLLLVIAFLIRRDGGPAFFVHERVGARGRTFGCLKFRTMVVDAGRVLQRVLTEDPAAAAEWNETHKLRRDPRITPIGRFLRNTSLDELPQLLNVLRLEMSLVGPRPIVRKEVPRYGADIAFYYETRPGLTGLWQVSGRADTSYERRVKLDCWYVKNWSIWHDVAIIAKTFPAVLSQRGAH